MSQVTKQIAKSIATAAFAERDAFGHIPTGAVQRAAEDAGVSVQDPIDGTDARSIFALAAYIQKFGVSANA